MSTKIRNPEYHGLPSGYTKLEYIESTGTQYIDTNILAHSDVCLEAKVKSNDITQTRVIGSSMTSYRFSLLYSSTGYITNQYGSTNNILSIPATTDICTLKNDNGKLYVDEVLVDTATEETFNIDRTWYVFASNSITDIAYSYCRIYYAKISTADRALFNGIPAKRNSDSVLGMYDTVTDTFFTNQGTGTFIAGPEISTYKELKELYKKNPESHGLPSEYTELEYIESTGTQYIDTEVIPTVSNSTKVAVDFQMTDITDGEYQSMGCNMNFTLYAVHTLLKFRACAVEMSNFDTNWHHIVWQHLSASRQITFDDTVYTASQNTSELPFYLFAMSATNTTYYGKYRIKSCLMWDNNILVRNFIPAKRNSDSVLGMYDTVTDTFFTNQGTGTFTAGSEVENYHYLGELYKKNPELHDLPSEYTELEYIEGTGTQYIDTGFAIGDGLFEADIKFQYTSLNASYNRLFGTSSNYTGIRGSTATEGNFFIEARETSSSTITTSIPLDTSIHTIVFNRNGNYYIDDTLVGTLSTTSIGTSESTLYLFKYNGIGSISKAKIYKFIIIKDNIEIRNMIPAKRNSDSVLGMYDTVNDVFYTNSGTSDDFTAGPEIENYIHIFSAGHDVEKIGNPCVMDVSRAKPISYKFAGNAKRTIEIDGTEYNCPLNYPLLDYAQNAASTKYSTGFTLTSAVNEFYCRFYCNDVSSLYMLQSRDYTTSDIHGITGSSSGGTIGYYVGNTKLVSSITRTIGHIYTVKGSCDGTTSTLYVKDETDGTEATDTATLSTFTANTTPVYLFGNTVQTNGAGYRIYEAYIKQDGKFVFVTKPALNGSTVGFYDFISNSFISAFAGSCTYNTQLPTPDNQLGIEFTGDASENLFDKSTITLNQYMKSDGAWGTSVAGLTASNPVSVTEGESITVKGYVSTNNNTLAMSFFDSTDTILSTRPTKDVTVDTEITWTETVPTDAVYVIINIQTSEAQMGDTWMIVKGTTAPSSYIPFGFKFPLIHAENCGMVDLGTFHWEYRAAYGFTAVLTPTAKNNFNGYCSKYPFQGSYTQVGDKQSGYIYYNNILIKDSDYGSDAAAFKAAMSGVYLYYQRSTDDTWTAPTTYTIYDDSQLMRVDTYADVIDSDGVRTTYGIAIDIGAQDYGSAPLGNYSVYDQQVAFSPLVMSDSGTTVAPMICEAFIPALDSTVRTSTPTARDGSICVKPDGNGFAIYTTEFDDDTLYPTGADKIAAFKAKYTGVYAYCVLRTATTKSLTVPSFTNAKGANYLMCNTEIPVSELFATYRRKYKAT